MHINFDCKKILTVFYLRLLKSKNIINKLQKFNTQYLLLIFHFKYIIFQEYRAIFYLLKKLIYIVVTPVL